MKCFFKTAVIASTVALSVASGVYAAGIAKSGYLERTVTVTNTGASMTQTTKMYWSGDRMRTEQYSVNGQTVEIKNGRNFYLYVPAKKAAVKTTLPAGASTVQQTIKSLAKPVKGGKKIGAGSVAGLKCDIYRVTPKGGSSATVYVSTDPRLPIPLKVIVSAGGVRQITDTKVVKLNNSISNSMFSLPRGVKVKEQKFNAPQKGQLPSGKK